jgi:hypothetical protein
MVLSFLAMKLIPGFLIFIFLISPVKSFAANDQVFVNAFAEAAVAYANDSFLLLGTIGDAFAGTIIPNENAIETVQKVQKRIRVIRARLREVSNAGLSYNEKRFTAMLDGSYACMDHLAWYLIQYIKQKTPENSQKFENQRTACLEKLKTISNFQSTLPRAPELAEPLSTR